MKCQKCKSIKCKNKCGTPPEPETEPCMYPYQNGAPWTVTPLVHVAGRASRLAPSLTALRLGSGGLPIDPTTIPDTWWRNISDEAQIAVNPKNPCNMIIMCPQDKFESFPLAMIVMYTLDNGATWNEGDISFNRMQAASVTGSAVPPEQGGANDDFQVGIDPSVCFDRKGNAYALAGFAHE